MLPTRIHVPRPDGTEIAEIISTAIIGFLASNFTAPLAAIETLIDRWEARA